MTKDDTKQADRQMETNANPDFLAGTSAAHPVETGVRATGGAAAGAAFRAIADRLGGNEVAEGMDSTVEEDLLEDQLFRTKARSTQHRYVTHKPAYRTGYEGRNQYPGRSFEEVEANLQPDYDNSKGKTTRSWDKAKHATWKRVENALSGDADRDGRPVSRGRNSA